MREESEGPLASAGDGGRVDRRGDFERDGREPGVLPGWRSDPGGGRGVEGRDAGTPAVVVVVVAGSSGDAQRRLALAERFLAATRLMAVLTRRTCLPRSHVASLRVTPMRESAKALKPWGFLQ